MKQENLLKLELELCNLLHPGVSHRITSNTYDLVVIGDDNQPLPQYTRNDAVAFALMCEYNLTPDRSSTSIPYESGWATVLGTNVRVDLRDFANLKAAYRVVIAMAVIEKLKR